MLEMLEMEFMQRAWLAGLIMAVICPLIGSFLVLRRQSLIGDGLGHIAFAGVAGGALWGYSPVLSAAAATILGALAIEKVRTKLSDAADMVLAIFFYSGMGLASEAGNNAVSGGAFIPVLTLGIPGDGATAIMMGALMVQGLQPGPLLFVEKAPDVYAIFIGLLLANLIMGIMGFSLIRLFTKVVNVPVHILLPIIVMMTFVGTYSYNNSLNDVYLMVISGFLGYFLNKLGFSMSAIIIGIILGGMAEQNFVGSLIMSDGNFNIFYTRPLCLFFLVAAVLSLLSPFIGKLFKKA